MSRLDEIAQDVRSVLMSCSIAMTIDDFEKSFKNLCGYNIPYYQLGYTCLENLLQSLSNVCKILKNRNGQIILQPISDSKTELLAKMLSEQKKSSKGVRLKPIISNKVVRNGFNSNSGHKHNDSPFCEFDISSLNINDNSKYDFHENLNCSANNSFIVDTTTCQNDNSVRKVIEPCMILGKNNNDSICNQKYSYFKHNLKTTCINNTRKNIFERLNYPEEVNINNYENLIFEIIDNRSIRWEEFALTLRSKLDSNMIFTEKDLFGYLLTNKNITLYNDTGIVSNRSSFLSYRIINICTTEYYLNNVTNCQFLNEVKNGIILIVSNNKNGISIGQLDFHFKMFHGYSIPYKNLGFASIDELLGVMFSTLIVTIINGEKIVKNPGSTNTKFVKVNEPFFIYEHENNKILHKRNSKINTLSISEIRSRIYKCILSMKTNQNVDYLLQIYKNYYGEDLDVSIFNNSNATQFINSHCRDICTVDNSKNIVKK